MSKIINLPFSLLGPSSGLPVNVRYCWIIIAQTYDRWLWRYSVWKRGCGKIRLTRFAKEEILRMVSELKIVETLDQVPS